MSDRKTRKVPAKRSTRLAKMAGLAGGLAGGMLAEGARKLSSGEIPKSSDLILTPANAKRVADQLANMRGAAMKLGQILSMDAGDLLPPEWVEVLARLRSDADAMPVYQLEQQLEAALGDEWTEHLYNFDYSPVASASIGQVHKAIGPKGLPLAVKIQYPGIAVSIDSDVDNLATLMRVSGILPAGIELKPMLDEVKQQLKDESNYLTEANYLLAYREKLQDDDRFAVPALYSDLTSESVLCMEFMDGDSIESVVGQAQAERDRVMTTLLDLMFTELFDWRMVQTDPNFANYLYREEDGVIVLLDFGATRRFEASFADQYKCLAAAAIGGNRKAMASAAVKLGYLQKSSNDTIRESLLDIFMLGAEPMLKDEIYDFSASDLAARLQEAGMELQQQIQQADEGWHNPPVAAMYFHRKIAGMFLLASRLKARVNVHRAITGYL